MGSDIPLHTQTHTSSAYSCPLYFLSVSPHFLSVSVSLTSYGCVQVWELSSGELLLSVLFDVEIMSVTTDPCDYFLFCGGSDGNIFQVSLCNQVTQAPTPPSILHLSEAVLEHPACLPQSLSRDKSFQSDGDGNQVFKGHR